MSATKCPLLPKLVLLAALVGLAAIARPVRCQPAASTPSSGASPDQPAAGASPAPTGEAQQVAAGSGLSLAASGPRCAVQGGAWLCLQGLRNEGTTLRAYLTYAKNAAGLQLVKNPALSLDATPQRLVGVNSFEKSGEPLSVLMVVKLVGTEADVQQVHPSLRIGVERVIKAAQKLTGSRIGLIGYNVRRANYQPNVELGDDAGLQAGVQLVPPTVSGLSFELFDALNEAVNRLERESAPRRRVLLVFTDGLEKDRDRDRLFQQLAQRAVRADVLVQVVMMPNREPKPYLKVLADSTGGLTQVPQDGDGVARAFGHVADELLNQSVATYELVRPATARPGSRQRHSIVLEYQGLSLSATEDISWTNAPAAQKPSEIAAQKEEPAARDPNILGTLLRGLVPLAAAALLGLLVFGLVRRFRRTLQPESAGNVFLLEGSAVKGAPSGRTPVAAVPLFRSAKPGPKGRPAPLVVFWLYEVGRQRTHVVSRFPYRIGNDLDCDLVLRGVGGDVASCQICFDRDQVSVRKWQGEPPQVNDRPLDGVMPVHSRAEFTVAGQLLVLYETPIS